MTIELRPYQADMVDRARDAMRSGARRVLMVLPTGGGKRVMAVHMIAEAVRRGKRCAFLVHRQELLDQALTTLSAFGLPCGTVKAGIKPDYDRPVQVASIASLVRRLEDVGFFDFIVHDESHHLRSRTHEFAISAWPLAHVVGFTATPRRLDGRGLGRWFQTMVIGPGMRWLIDRGHLADYRLFAPPPPDLGGIGTVAGDYNSHDLDLRLNRPKLVGDIVDHYRRHAPGLQALVFASSIRHSQAIAQAFWLAGIPAKHIDGDTPERERRLAIEDFAARRFPVLCNVDLFGEGLDLAGVEAVILARPTASLTVHLQQVGRALRPKPDSRKAVILDHAGNTERHGLPDEERTWTLDDDERKTLPTTPSIKLCPVCFAAVAAAVRHCPECGHAFIAEDRAPAVVDGRLVEVDRRAVQEQLALDAIRADDDRRRLREAAERAASFDELRAIGRKLGYNRGWAWHRAQDKGLPLR
jgi:DNA repair protein RadD